MRNGVDVPLGPPQPASAAALTSEPDPAAVAAPSIVKPLPYAPMSRVRIPAIRVDAPVIDVGLDPDGWIDAPPPQDPNLAGWYQNGVAPGQTRHRRGRWAMSTTRRGPAVFYGLGSLEKGNHIEVNRYDGRIAVFEIYGVEVFSKNDFPGARVYGDTGQPELRVITCGGGYSKAGGYDGNVVVFARLVKTR